MKIFKAHLSVLLLSYASVALADSMELERNLVTVLESNACPQCYLKDVNLFRADMPGVQLQGA